MTPLEICGIIFVALYAINLVQVIIISILDNDLKIDSIFIPLSVPFLATLILLQVIRDLLRMKSLARQQVKKELPE